MSEDYGIEVGGMMVRAILDHVTAADVIAGAGLWPLVIPDGCNTVSKFGKTAGGHVMLAVNQRGFARKLEDDEREVNGCMAFVVIDARGKSESEQQTVLDALYEDLHK